MKRLLFLSAVLSLSLGLMAQGTIQDYGTYIDFNYSTGDTISVGKDNITHILSRRDRVFIFTNHPVDVSTKPQNQLLIINPTDFGYSDIHTLRMYLAATLFRRYVETYSYDNGNLDTVSYYYNGTLQYQVVYGYTDALVTSKTVIEP